MFDEVSYKIFARLFRIQTLLHVGRRNELLRRTECLIIHLPELPNFFKYLGHKRLGSTMLQHTIAFDN